MRLLPLGVVTIFAGLALLPFASGAPEMKLPLLVAHRGASADAPENTLAAYRLAFEHNADAIEGDSTSRKTTSSSTATTRRSNAAEASTAKSST